jgi:S1-C subfamily serine protease
MGDAVGIVTMKLSNYDSICFAIPIDAAMQIFNAMKSGQTLTDELLSAVSRRPARLGIVAGEGETGVIIHEIEEKRIRRGEKILRTGDVITKINETEITDINTLRRIIERLEPGDEILITLSRKGQSLSIR